MGYKDLSLDELVEVSLYSLYMFSLQIKAEAILKGQGLRAGGMNWIYQCKELNELAHASQ